MVISFVLWKRLKKGLQIARGYCPRITVLAYKEKFKIHSFLSDIRELENDGIRAGESRDYEKNEKRF